jgi:hypothetical protein
VRGSSPRCLDILALPAVLQDGRSRGTIGQIGAALGELGVDRSRLILAKICGQFTESFDTADLKDGKSSKKN